MNDDEHINGLNLTAQDIERITEEAYQDVTKRIRAGEAPREAISAVMAQWQGAYLTVFGAALSERLRQSIGTTELKRYPLGPVSLSDRLYQNAKEVSAVTAEIIRQHNQGWQSARKLALQLYEGYNFKDDPLKVTASLPKYLRELMQAPLVGTELKRLLARIQINNLKTPYLKAAYLQALDGLEQGIGQDRLSKLLRTAFYERNRYFANRIAQTELHRAQANQRAREIMAEDGIRFVQVKLSSTHPVTDICDLHAKIDKYGVGAGVYPKELAPKPPFHPHCRCLLRPRVDIDPDTRFRERANAERNFLNALPDDEARKIAGSWDKLQRVRKGENLEAILNEGKDALYHMARLGDVVGIPGAILGDMPAFIQSQTVAQAQQYALQLGISSVDYDNDLTIANAVNTALDDATKRGIPMPDHVVTDDAIFVYWAQHYNSKPQSYPAAFTVDSSTGDTYLMINPLYAHWNDTAADAATQNSSGIWSSSHANHAVWHELGHMMVYNQSESDYKIFLNQQLTTQESTIASKVSSYAQTTILEFLAETFAGLLAGNSYSNDVINLYLQYGGIKP